MKRILFIITTLLVSIHAFAYDVMVNNIYYHINRSNKTAKVSSMTKTVSSSNSNLSEENSSAYSGYVTVPSTFEYEGETYTVTEIGKGAFYSCTNLTGVSVPSTVETIQMYAFCGCTSLSTVSLPSSLKYIGYQSFADCKSLTSITIPNSVTRIGEQAFVNCTSLSTISVPAKLCEIGAYAFYATAYLNNATAINGIKYVGNVACYYSGSNTSITFKSGTTGIADNLFSGSSITTVTIPSSCVVIGENSFYECTSLATVNFESSSKLTTIKRMAFYGCSKLGTMTIPSTVYKVGEYAFSNTQWLKNQTAQNNVIYAGKAAIMLASKTETATLKDGTLGIAPSIFCYRYVDSYTGSVYGLRNDNFKSLNIPSSVTFVDNEAFMNGLWDEFHINANVYIGSLSCNDSETSTEIFLGGKLKKITADPANPYFSVENGVLYNKDFTKLIGIPAKYEYESDVYKIRSSVNTICDGAIRQEKGLSSLIIPASVGELFTQCLPSDSAVSITFHALAPPSTSNGFLYFGGMTLYVPEESLELYKNNYPWNTAKEVLAIPSPINTVYTPVGEDWTSTNAGIPSSTSEKSYTFTCDEGSSLSFDWTVSSETNYDKLTVYLDGVSILVKSGVLSGKYNAKISGGSHLLRVAYTKDFSSDVNEDCATVKNVSISAFVAELKDGENFENPLNKRCTTISYERTFNDTEWQAWYAPFDVSFNNLKENFKVAKLNDVLNFDDNEDGCIDRVVLETILMDGDTIRANTPYVIKANVTGKKVITVKNSVLYSSAGSNHECSSLLARYIFKGNYNTISALEMNDNGLYSVSENKILVKQTTEDLGSYRWYMQIEGRNGVSLAPDTAFIKIALPVTGVAVNINEYGGATYCSPYALDFSSVEGLKAYIAADYNVESQVITMQRVQTAVAGSGLLLNGEPGEYIVPVIETSGDSLMNMLAGVLENTTVNAVSADGVYANYKYTISGNDNIPKFYLCGDGSSITAGKAYLRIPLALLPSDASMAIDICFDEGEFSGIDEVEDVMKGENGKAKTVYDLQGRVVENPTSGLYIIDGKKMLIK